MKDVYVVIETNQVRGAPDAYVYEKKEAARSRFDSIVKDLVYLGYKNTYRHELDDVISVDYEMEDVPDTCISVRIMPTAIIKGAGK